MKKQISIWMTPEEVKKIDLVRAMLQRRSYSDTIRVLVANAAEKNLLQNSAMAVRNHE